MTQKPTKRKRPTREQLDERLEIPLETQTAMEAIVNDPDSPEARRQRVRDRAGDDPPPRGAGGARK